MGNKRRPYGQIIHDWGLGSGTFLIGLGALLAAWHTDEILEKILGVQNISNEIKATIGQMKDSDAKFQATISQMKESDDNLQKAVNEISEILDNIHTDLKKIASQKTVASVQPDATSEQIQRALSPLVNSGCPSKPYLTEKLMGKVQNAWGEVQDPKKREEILFDALQICSPMKQRSNMSNPNPNPNPFSNSN